MKTIVLCTLMWVMFGYTGASMVIYANKQNTKLGVSLIEENNRFAQCLFTMIGPGGFLVGASVCYTTTGTLGIDIFPNVDQGEK